MKEEERECVLLSTARNLQLEPTAFEAEQDLWFS